MQERTFSLTIGSLQSAIGQHFATLIVNMLAMILVARSFALQDFGSFSFLIALYHMASFISECGICKRLRDNYRPETNNDGEITNAKGALLLTGTCTFFAFLLAAYSNISPTHEDTILGYCFMALAVPLANGNRLRTTLLHAMGKHELASKSQMKRHFVFLFTLWLLSHLQMPSILVACYLFTELYHRFTLLRLLKLPAVITNPNFNQSVNTIRNSLPHLLSGEAFALIFHTDIFILGLFKGSLDLGMYAQAALLGRFFLLIPVGIRPVLHRHLASFVREKDAYGFSFQVHRIRAYIFYVHALLVLLLTCYFDSILVLLTGFPDQSVIFNIFILLLPGYLFYSAAVINESALEASGSGPFLGRLSLTIILLNVLLTFYLVPFAGVFGAAAATLFSLMLYFIILCSLRITLFSTAPLLEFLTATALLYPLKHLITTINLNIVFFILLIPPVIFFLFYLLSFFDFANKPSKKGHHLTP